MSVRIPRRRRTVVIDRAARKRFQFVEPSLDELLNDPMIEALMARDGINRATVHSVIDSARQRLKSSAGA